MPDFEFEFNSEDRDLVLNQQASNLNDFDYIRLTIYPSEGVNNVVTLLDSSRGVDGKAIFFSTLNTNYYPIDISPFTRTNEPTAFDYAGELSDFKIYKNGDNVFIKPNEIFNKFELPQGDYRIQIDFLRQVKPSIVNPTADTGEQQDDSSGDVQVQQQFYQFLIKEISTSRKEVRIKLVNGSITRNSNIISELINEFNNFEPEFLGELDEQGNPLPNPNYKYQFKHVLNIGTGDHNPIMNYTFDRFTDGRDNQSIILKLYEPLSDDISNLKAVTIEREILTTQIQDIYYFSDVPEGFIGSGLLPDLQENWINPDNNQHGFQSIDELAISKSIGDIAVDGLISSSEYDYPNLNTDFNEFENHTFFGSAKKKLENFKAKVETIQTHYSEISKSLSISSSLGHGDSTFVIEKRQALFDKVQHEFKNLTPYEKFLYFDAQTDSTASAPSLKNYADTIPVQFSGEGIELNKHNGFNVVYKHSSEKISGTHNEFIDLFTDKYFVEQKPFFNASGSIYLSFLLQGDSGSSITWENRNKNLVPPLPQDIFYQNNVLNPDMTGSAHQRYVFEASMSYFIPNTLNNDMADLVGQDFDAGSNKIIIVDSNIKTGSQKMRDSTNQYSTTVVSQSGVPFFGSVMPSGELFRIFYKNTLSSSLQTWFKFDEGSGTDALNSAGTLTGSLKNGATYATDGVVNTALSLDGVNDCVELSADAFGDLSSTDFSITAWINPTSDVSEFDAIAVRRSNSGKGFVFDLRDKSGENDGAHPFGIGMAIQGSSLDAFDSSATIPTGSYSHVAAVVDRDANAKLYVNGVEVGSQAIDLTDQGADITGSNNKIGIGARIKDDGTFSNKFPGEIDEFRFYRRALTPSEVNQLFLHPDGKTETKITDVKVTLKDPTDVLPFDNIFKTTSTEFTDWYNNALTQAETFDTDNIHSFENNLPEYIRESSDYNDMKDFLNLQGEQYDLIRNHIDSMGTLHKRGYKKNNSPPNNVLPMLLSNMGWQAINPFSGSLTDTLGSYLDGITSIDDIKNNTWRKTLNNLLYIYKSKGTKNSVRGLLNTYGYPPDVLEFQEFGGSTEESNPRIFTNKVPTSTGVDLDLKSETGSFSFTTNKQRFNRYIFAGKNERTLNLDWWMDDANLNTIQFVYKHIQTTNTQTILKSSGSGAETLWDLRLVPSSDGASSSFEFRLNNSQVADTNIGSRGFSMSLAFDQMTDGQLWNVMLQRMTGSTNGTGEIEYRLHSALQEESKISSYNYVTMSVSGGLEGGTTLGGKGFFANSNFQSSGSRHYQSSSNLFVGETISGSLAEIRGWSTALSTSKFRQHVLNKFSTVGNNILSHCRELVYHFKLNENYNSSSVSSSTQMLKIIDSSPTIHHSKYTFEKSSSLFSGSLTYGFDFVDVNKLSLQDNNSQKSNDNSILINPQTSIVGNLNSNNSSVNSLTNNANKKPKFKTSTKLELYRSPQTFVDNFILDKLSGFNLETKYAAPRNFYSQSYKELDDFREEFFLCHPIKSDVNKFIRAQESMFNNSIVGALQTLVPGRVTFGSDNSNFGVEIRPTILEKQKYENEHHSVETNPNTFSASVSPSPDLSTSEFIQPKSGSVSVNVINVSTHELPKSASINVNVTNVSTHETPKLGSITTSPSLTDSSVPTSKDGTIDYASIANESYSDVHKNWGRTNDDVQHINFAAPTASDGTFNTYDIESRFVFHTIGDNEYYSASFNHQGESNFENHNNFYNHILITDGPAKNVKYFPVLASGAASEKMLFHNLTKDFIHNGKRMGKTRFFREVKDFDFIVGNTQLILPRNHVTKFSQPFKEQMSNGTQNTNPGFLNVQHEDYSSASFYRVKVTGGENQIYVKGTSNPTKDETDDRIIY